MSATLEAAQSLRGRPDRRRLCCAGPTPVLYRTPPRLEPATDNTLMRLLELYRHADGLEELPPLRAGSVDTSARRA